MSRALTKKLWGNIICVYFTGRTADGRYCDYSSHESSRIRLCRLPFRRTLTDSYSAKWWRGLCGPPTLRVSLCRGHAMNKPSERSMWRLRTSGTHYRTTFVTPVHCQTSVPNWKHSALLHCILVMTNPPQHLCDDFYLTLRLCRNLFSHYIDIEFIVTGDLQLWSMWKLRDAPFWCNNCRDQCERMN